VLSYNCATTGGFFVKQSLPLLAAACGLALCHAALAADDTPSVQARIDALQKQLDDLKRDQEAAKKPQGEQPKITSNNGRFTLASADGYNTIAFRLFVQGYAGWYDQDPTGPLATDYRRGSVGATPNRDNNAARDLNNGFVLRRARVGIEGILSRDFGYKLIAEFGGSGTETQGRVNDAWVSYSGLAPFTFQVGAFTPASNFEDGTSADDITFVERPAPGELARTLGAADARLGVGARASGKRWMSAFTITGRTVADPEPFDSQTAAVGRVGFLASTSNAHNLHLGASATYVIHPSDQGLDAGGVRYPIRFRERPELRVDSARLIDTGNIDAEHAHVYGVELGGNWKNFQVQAENFWYGIERLNSTARDPKFGGYYVQGTWALTGESRRYAVANGAYQAPRPRTPVGSGDGWGAFELALRFSHTDFNFEEGAVGTAPSLSAVRGGEQDIWTIGANWYATSNIKVVLNYLLVDVDRLNPAAVGAAPFGAAPSTPPVGVEIGQKFKALALRTQFNF
jgi:phosphate-selective porin OprO and OprP